MIHTLSQLAAACGGSLRGVDRPFKEVVIDSRKLAAGDVFAALPGEHVDGHAFVGEVTAHGAAGALVTRELPFDLPQIVVPNVEVALTAAARAARTAYHGRVVGVAGSNGKTTVKEMTAAVLAQRGACLATRGNLNNHLGVPLTLLRLRAEHISAVIEMGANRAGDVAQLAQLARPEVGLITNAGAEHLEGFGSLDGVARAEGEMVTTLPASGIAIINADDVYASLWQSSTVARVVRFGVSADAEFSAREVQWRLDEQGFATRFLLRAPGGEIEVRLALAGQHNVLNALAAAAAASGAGATLEDIRAGLAAVRAVKGRLQLRRRPCGAWLIDDSYNANPSSVRAGLQVLAQMPGRHWLVLGDMAELGDYAVDNHRELGELARGSGVERLYTFGGLAALAADSFGAGAQRFEDGEQLRRTLESALRPDVTVLIKGSRVNRLERLADALAAPGT